MYNGVSFWMGLLLRSCICIWWGWPEGHDLPGARDVLKAQLCGREGRERSGKTERRCANPLGPARWRHEYWQLAPALVMLNVVESQHFSWSQETQMTLLGHYACIKRQYFSGNILLTGTSCFLRNRVNSVRGLLVWFIMLIDEVVDVNCMYLLLTCQQTPN